MYKKHNYWYYLYPTIVSSFFCGIIKHMGAGGTGNTFLTTTVCIRSGITSYISWLLANEYWLPDKRLSVFSMPLNLEIF